MKRYAEQEARPHSGFERSTLVPVPNPSPCHHHVRMVFEVTSYCNELQIDALRDDLVSFRRAHRVPSESEKCLGPLSSSVSSLLILSRSEVDSAGKRSALLLNIGNLLHVYQRATAKSNPRPSLCPASSDPFPIVLHCPESMGRDHTLEKPII